MVRDTTVAVGRVAVAVSGGGDSVALLHATLRAARPLGVTVFALHVHHGLLPEADGWQSRLAARCARWARAGWPLEFRTARLAGSPAPGESVEAWARAGRYAALADMARAAGATLVLLAHHRRDQAETVLLQALRGAGMAGLAAMPREIRRQGLAWARPWLARPAEAIDAYRRRWRLGAETDPSNRDPRYARSRLRHRVMPALNAAFEQAEAALASVARHAFEARQVLTEIAEADLLALGAVQELPLAPWCAISPARRANALRAWLAARSGETVSDSLVRRMLDELRPGASLRWPAGAGREWRSWRGRLRLVDIGPANPDVPEAADGMVAYDSVTIHGPGWFETRLSGRLEVFVTDERGLPPTPGLVLRAAARHGGERFALAPGGLPRRLKKQYQAAGVPAWERGGPLWWDGERLVFAPGLGVDARAWAPSGAPQWGLRWHPDPPAVRPQSALSQTPPAKIRRSARHQ